MKKSWIQAGTLVLAIIGGITVVNRIRMRKIGKTMGQSEANILAKRLSSQALSEAEILRINNKLAAAGWKVVGETAVRA